MIINKQKQLITACDRVNAAFAANPLVTLEGVLHSSVRRALLSVIKLSQPKKKIKKPTKKVKK